MNSKGQLSVGQIVILAVVIILGAVFAVAIADNQAILTTTQETVNDTVTLPANGSSINLNGQAVQGSVTAVNSTGGETIGSGNYTVANYQTVDGQFTATLTIVDTEYAGEEANLTYTYEPVGYNTDSGARGIAGMILLFFILAVMAYTLPGIRDWLRR